MRITCVWGLDESAASLDRVAKDFLAAMGDMTKTSTVMLDRDQASILAMRQNLPHARILLCSFHVLKNFKKRVSELLLPTGDEEKIFRTMRRILYAKSEDHMDQLMSELLGQNEEMFLYLSSNWMEDKEMWALHLRDSIITFGNNTNNRLEAENGKLKHLLSSSSSLTECVRSLMLHNQILDAERCYSNFLQTSKSTHYLNTEPDIQALFSSLTDFAISKVQSNYKQYDVMVIGEETSRVYHVTDQDKSYNVNLENKLCSCTFSCQYQLPCRHQIYLTRHLGLEVADLAVGSRWCKANTRLESQAIDSSVRVSVTETNAVLTANQRYNKASDLTKRLAHVMSTFGTQQFLHRHNLLKEILTMWEAGHELSIADLQPEPHDDDESTTKLPDLEPLPRDITSPLPAPEPQPIDVIVTAPLPEPILTDITAPLREYDPQSITAPVPEPIQTNIITDTLPEHLPIGNDPLPDLEIHGTPSQH